MPVVVTPSTAVGTTLVLDGLDLASGNYELTSFTPPIPAKRQEWVEGADADGAILTRDPLVSNGQAVAVIDMFASDKDAAHALIGAIVQKLEEADRNPTGIPLEWTPSGASQTATFYVLSGQVTDLPIDFKFDVANVPTVTITMDCRPGGYGAEITTSSATVTGPLVTLDLAGIQGDMPTDEATLIITEMSSQSRRHVEWGMEQRYYNPASPWSLILDSDSLVTSGFAGAQATLAGSYDPNATGNNAILATLYGTAQAVCGTGTQPHVGTFRVKTRVNSGTSGSSAYWRFAWRAGDGSYVTNGPTLLSTTVQNFYELDLGLITIPIVSAGTQAWDGRVEAYTETGVQEVVYVDYIELIPAGEGYGKARAVNVVQPGAITGGDDFTGTTAGSNLNARVAPSGGTWATSGADAADFTFSDALSGEQITRTSVTGNDRLALLGTTTYSDVEVNVAATPYSFAAGASANSELIGRYVNATNQLILRANWTYSGLGGLNLTALISGSLMDAPTIQFFFATGSTYRLRLAALSSGYALAQVLTPAGSVLAETSFTSPWLTTGGAIATGKVGILDYASGTAATRYYDDFTVSSLPTESPALFSTRTLEVNGSEVRRQNSGGTTYGRPGEYRGSRFILQPAGVEGRTTRVIAKAHRNDVDATIADQIADQMKLQVRYKPRYSVVPY